MKANEAKGPAGNGSRQNSSATPFFSKDGSEQHSFFGQNKAADVPFFNAQPIQAKLQIGEANDTYEQEADAVADHVVSKDFHHAPAAQNQPVSSEHEDKLHKKEDAAGTAGPASQSLSTQLDATKGGGQPLPSELSQSMGTAIGADFSGVRVHTDSAAADMSKSISAQAFTTGNDIYFNEGKYNPTSTSGQHLLAHELTHTVQQRASAQRKPVQRKPDISMMPSATIQRNIGDWGGWPWNWGSSDADKKGDDKVLKKVKAAGAAPGTNFDSTVSVPAPLPALGDMMVSMRININFQDANLKFLTDNVLSTDKANLKVWKKAIEKLQKTNPAKLKWTEPEKEKVRKDYQKNVDDVWPSDKSKLTFKLDTPDYEKYQVKNNFKMEFTDKNAHHKFSVVKMIDGPTLRSYMGGDLGGFHDSRTFGGTQNNGNIHNMHSEQIGEFDNDSAALTPGIRGQLTAMVANVNKIKEAHKSDTPTPAWNMNIIGRANSTGDAAHNLKLSRQRAIAVGAELTKTLGTDVAITTATDAKGNAKADNSNKYRRVEAVFSNTNGTDLEQITMAHETGHLFGYGDEYGDVETSGVLPKYAGDEANGTSQAIRDAGMGEDVVREHGIENNSDSIMNAGNVVGVGHYSLFLTQLKNMATDVTTNAQVDWRVVKG